MIRATSRDGMVVLLRNGYYLTALTPRQAANLAAELESAAGESAGEAVVVEPLDGKLYEVTS